MRFDRCHLYDFSIFEIARFGSVRLSFFKTRTVRCGAVFTFSKSYGAVRCGVVFLFYGAEGCGLYFLIIVRFGTVRLSVEELFPTVWSSVHR